MRGISKYNNPHEWYSYYELPFCKPNNITDQQPIVLNTGASASFPLLEIPVHDSGFSVEISQDGSILSAEQQSCTSVPLTRGKAYYLKNHIESFFYEGSIAGLPVYQSIGDVVSVNGTTEDTAVLLLYTTLALQLTQNGRGEIVHAELKVKGKEQVEVGKAYTFRMNFLVTRAEAASTSWQDRWDSYVDP
ncbi:MAG: hypothetical protein SGILL_006891, partial [Bacillariaceae sp.]